VLEIMSVSVRCGDDPALIQVPVHTSRMSKRHPKWATSSAPCRSYHIRLVFKKVNVMLVKG
jgi:hypothetical protein